MRKKQLGGFGINPSMAGLFNGLDLNNLDFQQVSELGSKIGGEPFDQALAQDDPSIYMNSIISGAANMAASANNPDPAEVQKRIDRQVQAYTQLQRTRSNATGASMFNRQYNPELYRRQLEQKAQNQAGYQGFKNYQQGLLNAAETNSQYNQGESLLNLFNSIGEFKKGGKIMQKGGVPPAEGTGLEYMKIPPDEETSTYDDIINFLDGVQGKIGGKYMDKAREKAEEITDKEDYDERDALRHAGASMYMTSGQGPAVSMVKAPYTTLMGLFHEISNRGPMDQTLSDLYNNQIGVLIGSLPVSEKKKEALLEKAYDKGILSVIDNKEMQSGGNIQTLGYSDNSPFKNLPQIDIMGNKISMANTGQPLMAIPDIGTPKLMKPYSGLHTFPGASKVTEVPMGKGGKKKKIPYYQEGGAPNIPTAVQLEENELIVTPQLDILDTSAKEKHEKLAKDVVTDMIRDNDYVFSDRSKITLKEAENLSLGLGAMLYEEGQIPDMPEEHTAAKFFKKGEKSLSIAEYVRRVRQATPQTEEDDVFSKKTNDANKAARLPYIAAAVYVNELKRTKGKTPMHSFASTFTNKFEGSKGAMMGVDQSSAISATALPSGVPEGQDGGPLALLSPVIGLTNFVTGLADSIFVQPKRNKLVKKALQEDRSAINNIAQTQSQFSGAANLANIAGVVGQDPTVSAPQYSPDQLNQRIRRVPRTLFDAAAGKLMSSGLPAQRAIFNNSGSFAQGVNAYAPIHASNVGEVARLGAQSLQTNIGLENQYRDMKQAFDDRQVSVDNTARNATRTNVNQLTSNLAGNISSGIRSQGTIESNRLNELRRNDLLQTQAKLDGTAAIQQGLTNSFGQLGYAAASMPEGMFNQPVNNNVGYPNYPPSTLTQYTNTPLNQPVVSYGNPYGTTQNPYAGINQALPPQIPTFYNWGL